MKINTVIKQLLQCAHKAHGEITACGNAHNATGISSVTPSLANACRVPMVKNVRRVGLTSIATFFLPFSLLICIFLSSCREGVAQCLDVKSVVMSRTVQSDLNNKRLTTQDKIIYIFLPLDGCCPVSLITRIRHAGEIHLPSAPVDEVVVQTETVVQLVECKQAIR